jgi:hypothetical protein
VIVWQWVKKMNQGNRFAMASSGSLTVSGIEQKRFAAGIVQQVAPA